MAFSSMEEKALHGTTTVGLVARDAVVLAADRRATAGTFIAHKRTKKIIKVGDKMALTTAGLVADAQVLADWLNAQIRYLTITRRQPVTVREAAHLLSLILYRYKSFPFYVQLILGGYDSSPKLFSLDLFGSVLEEKYAATGSGSPIAMGVLEEGYREDMVPEDARKLAVRAVQMALRRDSATGDGVDSIIIDKQGVKEFSDPILP
ncbi:MAG: archaeal proteasome endopeptidase complex subunit beta [Thermoprotei archaeon]|jgi:proteasome beta subunit|nr:archaeal proteasome endopeptidase complex subunit beta [Thermoprotei archaeon]